MTKIQLLGGTSKVLARSNGLPSRRELIIETDTNRIKVGDGVSRYNELPYTATPESTVELSNASLVILGVENTPIINPAYGDAYIIGPSPSGVFAGYSSNTLARYTDKWNFSTPAVGDKVINIRNGEILLYRNNAWEVIHNININNDAIILTEVEFTDSNTSTLYSGESWNFSTFNVSAKYSRGVGNSIDQTLTTNITNEVDFMLDGTTRIYNGDTININNTHSITVSYTNYGRTYIGSISKTIRYIDSAFMPYFNTYIDDAGIHLASFNSAAYAANPADISVYSQVVTDGAKKNVIIDETLFNGAQGQASINNLYFPDNNYASNGNLSGGWFKGTGFNGNIIFPNNISNFQFDNMFASCTIFDKPVSIPYGVTSCYNAFAGATNFDNTVDIPTTVVNYSQMFAGAKNFNKPVNIWYDAKDCSNMFANVSTFLNHIYIHPTASSVNMDMMFFNSDFLGDIDIPLDSSCYRMFYNDTLLERNVSFNQLTNSAEMFRNCYRMNNNVTSWSLVSNNSYAMFYNCTDLRTIHDIYTINSDNCESMFYNCTSLSTFSEMLNINSPVARNMFRLCNSLRFTNYVYINAANCQNMFTNCTWLNNTDYIELENGCQDCTNMFANCYLYNINLTIPDTVTSVNNMFVNCFINKGYLDIGNGITNAHTLFRSATSFVKDEFNGTIVIGSGITNASSLFAQYNSRKLNVDLSNATNLVTTNFMFQSADIICDITLPESVTNCYCMFNNGYFDGNIDIQCSNADSLFHGLSEYKHDVFISDSVTTCQGIFSGCDLSGNVHIGNNVVTQLSSIFSTMNNKGYYNKYVYIGDSLTSCFTGFINYTALNTSPHIGNNVVNCDRMFYNCQALNCPIDFPYSATNFERTFCNCISLQNGDAIHGLKGNAEACFSNCSALRSVNLGEITKASYLFWNTQFDNGEFEVNIPDTCTNIYGIFCNVQFFNGEIYLGNGISNAMHLFWLNNATNANNRYKSGPWVNSYNNIVYLGNKVTNCSNLFNGFNDFNSTVDLRNATSLTNCSNMFRNCINFEVNDILIPDSVINTVNMFYRCIRLPSMYWPIPSKVTNSAYMFYNCTDLEGDITIEGHPCINYMFFNCSYINQVWLQNGFTYALNAFYNCSSLQTIYIYGAVTNAVKMLYGRKSSYSHLDIFVRGSAKSKFNGTAAGNSITGAAIKWTYDSSNSNIFYNTTYDINVYIE